MKNMLNASIILIILLPVISANTSLVLPSTKDECFESYSTRYGTFSFPRYGSQNGKTCQWRITANPKEKIHLKIIDMNLEKSTNCSDNYIEIRDGHWSTSPLLGKFCGKEDLNPIVSTRNQMLVRYFSKRPTQGKFAAKYEAICGGEIFVEESFLLKSPNYPKRYPLDKKCIWKIVVPDGNRVSLKFKIFDLESHKNCSYDYVEIRDGPTEENNLIGIYCGQTIPSDILSSTNYLYIKFVSDFTQRKAGFLAAIINDNCNKRKLDGSCEDSCGGLITSERGIITSPQYPHIYPPNQYCVWSLLVSPESRIQLSFNHLDIEGENNTKNKCIWDKLEISSVNSDNELTVHGIYCGNERSTTLVSDSNAMKIIFQSDSLISGTGFSLNYFTIPDINKCAVNNGNCRHQCVQTREFFGCVCNGTSFNNGRDCNKTKCKYEISSSSGVITSPNYPNNYPPMAHCEWLFTTTPGHRIELVFDELKTENCHDYVILYDGYSSQQNIIKKLCGSSQPSPVTSSKNELLVTFKSDRSNEFSGFKSKYFSICGGTLQALNEIENYIYSHYNFGLSHYSNNTDCEWLINAPIEKKINITFTFFELEDANCQNDYVEVFNARHTLSLGRFCGRIIPSTIFSNESVLIKFHTDGSTTYRGFSLIYSTAKLEDVPNY